MTDKLRPAPRRFDEDAVEIVEAKKSCSVATTSPASVYLSSLGTAAGRSSMQWALRTMARMLDTRFTWGSLPWHELRQEHLVTLRAQLGEKYGPRTANRMLIALRRVLEEAWRMGLIPSEIYHRLQVERFRVYDDPTGRVLTPIEVSDLVEAAESARGLTGRRDAALVAVCYAAGLRRSEAARLRLGDYKTVLARELHVTGKGGKKRLAYVAMGWADPVDAWARELRRLDCKTEDPLFPRIIKPRNGPERLGSRPMTPGSLNELFAKLQKRADLSPFSPHDLRRSFATTLLDEGVDIITVQRLMGHENVATTAIYDRRGEKAKKAAADKLTRPK